MVTLHTNSGHDLAHSACGENFGPQKVCYQSTGWHQQGKENVRNGRVYPCKHDGLHRRERIMTPPNLGHIPSCWILSNRSTIVEATILPTKLVEDQVEWLEVRVNTMYGE